MSTPNEGPGLRPWTPGDARDAAQALSQLNPREQQALGRVIKAAAAVGPIINGVARGISVIRNTMTRLSELAQRLYSSGVNRGAQIKEQASDKAGELSQRRKDAVSAARGTAVNVKDWAVALPGRAADLGKAALAGGQAAAGRAGRWFNQQISRGAAKASAALAGLAARRSDPTLNSPDQKLQKRDILLAQKAGELFTSPDNQRAAKAAELAAFVQNAYGTDPKVSLEKPGGPEQSVDAGARTTAATHEMAWVLKGTAPATEIHSGTPAAPDAASTGEQTGRHAKKEGPDQSGQTRD